MFKKFLLTFIFALITVGYINVKADSFYRVVSFPTINKYYWVSESGYNNTTEFSSYDQYGNSYTFIKPVIVKQPYRYNDTQTSYRIISKTLWTVNSDEYPSGNGVSNGTTQNVSNDYSDVIFYDILCFNNYNDASLYSRGLDYNASNIVGGQIPISYTIGNDDRPNVILNFDKSLNGVVTPAFDNRFNDGTYFVRIVEQYDVPEGASNHHMFKLNFSIPSNNAMTQIWNKYYATAEVTNDNLKVFMIVLKQQGVNAVYGSNGKKQSSEYTTFELTVDADYMSSQNICNISYEQSAGSVIYTDFEFYDFKFNSDALTGLTYIPNGILGQIVNYYNSIPKALLALQYINFNYIQCWSYDIEEHTVYNPCYVYYPDQVYSDGKVAEHRQFGNSATVVIDDVTEPDNNNPIVGDNTTPSVTVPQNTLDSIFSTSIQDSYNNITNNYYYDHGLTENILDYYRGFSDGATDENIDSALGYVKGTLGSLTHIPLLLSYCFNAFFPIEIIRLFQALLIIFVVFMIIRIIKHLFTH